jgi:hypothetical protein
MVVWRYRIRMLRLWYLPFEMDVNFAHVNAKILYINCLCIKRKRVENEVLENEVLENEVLENVRRDELIKIDLNPIHTE